MQPNHVNLAPPLRARPPGPPRARRCRGDPAASGEWHHIREETMSTASLGQGGGFDTAAIMGGLYGDGFIGLKGAFDRGWVRDMRADIDALFAEALARPGGAVGRGPNRYYVEVH